MKRPIRRLRNHQKRVVLLREIDLFLQQSGPITFRDFVLEFDIYLATLFTYRYQGYLKTRIIPSNKQSGKATELISVNWDVINAIPIPDKLLGKREILDKIKILTLTEGKTLKELARKVPRPVSTLRYWQREGLLKSKLGKKGKTIILGTNH